MLDSGLFEPKTRGFPGLEGQSTSYAFIGWKDRNHLITGGLLWLLSGKASTGRDYLLKSLSSPCVVCADWCEHERYSLGTPIGGHEAKL